VTVAERGANELRRWRNDGPPQPERLSRRRNALDHPDEEGATPMKPDRRGFLLGALGVTLDRDLLRKAETL
jgi:hypothetical protein